MPINKVTFGDNTLIDISDSTVTADSLLEGKKAYGADGSAIVGIMTQKEARYILDASFDSAQLGEDGSPTTNKVNLDASAVDAGLLFYLISDGCLGVKWFGSPDAVPSAVTIPSTWTFNSIAYTVNEIAEFKNMTQLETINIPESVKYIAEDAFEGGRLGATGATPLDLSSYDHNVAVLASTVTSGVNSVVDKNMLDILNGVY